MMMAQSAHPPASHKAQYQYQYPGRPNAPSTYPIQNSSPLDTLVRSASTKGSKYDTALNLNQYRYPSPREAPVKFDDNNDYYRNPSSPLLHSHFARSSQATYSTRDTRDALANSYMDFGSGASHFDRDSVDSKATGAGALVAGMSLYEPSVYAGAKPEPALRDSWKSDVTAREKIAPVPAAVKSPPPDDDASGWDDTESEPPSPSSPGPPVVVVSAWSDTPQAEEEDMPRYSVVAGKTPIVKPVVANFSRPQRPPQQYEYQYEYQEETEAEQSWQQLQHQPERVQFHDGMTDGVDHKRMVMERNASRSQPNSGRSPVQHGSTTRYLNQPSPTSSPHGSPTYQPRTGSRSPSPHPSPSHSPGLYSPNSQPRTPQTASSTSTSSSTNSGTSNSTTSTSASGNARSPGLHSPQAITLPRNPPSLRLRLRSDSPVSLYSTYSFYQLDSASPSPTEPGFVNEQKDTGQIKGTHTKVLAQPPSRTTSRPGTPTREAYPAFDINAASSKSSNLGAHVHFGGPSSSPSSQNHSSSNHPDDPDSNSPDPQHHLTLGISLHERGELRQSAVHFEKSATLNGGCGVGMLMWGLALRHGWGVQKDEKRGFNWLRRAAEGAVGELEGVGVGAAVSGVGVSSSGVGEIRNEGKKKEKKKRKKDKDKDKLESSFSSRSFDDKASVYTVTPSFNEKSPQQPTAPPSSNKSTPPTSPELTLAIYEVAQSFFHGWGVPKHPETALQYYTVAARLGDMDAQLDLAFCLANGKGCKKDRKEAAGWYREAVKQGASEVGLAWIWKEKFQ